jgi:hypothetical protein
MLQSAGQKHKLASEISAYLIEFYLYFIKKEKLTCS